MPETEEEVDIAQLRAVLPPPSEPVETGTPAGWREVQRALGTALPTDYMQFIGTYGTGAIDQFIWVFNPFAANENLNLLQEMERRAASYRQLREAYPDEYPYALFPEKDGLLSWAATDNGDDLLWLTKGDPEEWTAVVWATRSSDFYECAQPMSVFLSELVTGALVCPAFPEEFLAGPPRFLREDEVSYGSSLVEDSPRTIAG